MMDLSAADRLVIGCGLPDNPRLELIGLIDGSLRLAVQFGERLALQIGLSLALSAESVDLLRYESTRIGEQLDRVQAGCRMLNRLDWRTVPSVRAVRTPQRLAERPSLCLEHHVAAAARPTAVKTRHKHEGEDYEVGHRIACP